jgi:type IV secretory pathway VirB10-like protein
LWQKAIIQVECLWVNLLPGLSAFERKVNVSPLRFKGNIKMKKLLIAFFCTSLLISATVSADVYKWKDKNGKTQYSDTPPMSNIPYTTLSGKKPAQPAQPASAPATDPKKAEEAAKNGKPAQGAPAAPNDPNASKNKVSEDLKEKAAKEAEAKKQQEEKLQAEKKAKDQACKAARSKLAQFEQGGRIYRTNESGERDYYGDKEIAAEIENAKSDIAENCE